HCLCAHLCLSFFNSTTNEGIGSGRIFACRNTGRENTHAYHDRILRRVAETKSLSCRRGLHRRRGIPDSNRLGRVSSVGFAELELATRDCAVVNRISYHASSRLGLRHYGRGNSGHTANARNSSTPQCYRTHCRWCDRVCRGRVLSLTASSLAENRQINRGSSV